MGDFCVVIEMEMRSLLGAQRLVLQTVAAARRRLDWRSQHGWRRPLTFVVGRFFFLHPSPKGAGLQSGKTEWEHNVHLFAFTDPHRRMDPHLRRTTQRPVALITLGFTTCLSLLACSLQSVVARRGRRSHRSSISMNEWLQAEKAGETCDWLPWDRKLIIQSAGALGDLRRCLSNSYRWSVSFLRQHAEHATVLHGDSSRGAARRCFPVPKAGDAKKRQHVRVGAGVNVRGTYHQPSQGKRQRECLLWALSSAGSASHQTPFKNLTI